MLISKMIVNRHLTYRLIDVGVISQSMTAKERGGDDSHDSVFVAATVDEKPFVL